MEKKISPRVSSATRVMVAYLEMVEKFENPAGSALAELQGATEYLLDKIKEARRRGVESFSPSDSYSGEMTRIRKGQRG